MIDVVSNELNGTTTNSQGHLRPRHIRRFTDLTTMIKENSLNRIYLGVHWRFDGLPRNAANNIGGCRWVSRSPTRCSRRGWCPDLQRPARRLRVPRMVALWTCGRVRYAGVMAANRLTQRNDVDVTLINARPRFVHRMRLHQLVAGSDDAVVDYSGILADRIRLVVGTVTRISPAERRISLAAGDSIAYDYLIYAAGSRSGPNRMFRVPLSSRTRSPAWRRRSGRGVSSTPHL